MRTALAVLIALLVELGSGLGPWLASPNTRKAEDKPAETASAVSVAADTPVHVAALEEAASEAPTETADELDRLVARFAAGALARRRGAYVPASEVRAAFEAFCQAEGAEPANATAFGKAMTRLGYERAKVGGVMRYESVAISATSTQPALRVVAEGGRRVAGPFSAKQLFPSS